MNTFYHFNGDLYEKIEDFKPLLKKSINKSFDVLTTKKSFKKVYDEFLKIRFHQEASLLESLYYISDFVELNERL